MPVEPTYPTSAPPPEAIPLGPLTLRRWRTDDVAELDAVVQQSVDHLRPFMGWAPTSTPEEIAAFLGRARAQWEARTAYGFALTLPTTGAVVGSGALMGRLGPGALEIGYWVAADATGRGFATLATAALARAGLALPGIERIEVHHDVANTASARVPAKLGFTHVGEVEAEVEAEAETGVLAVWAIDLEQWSASPGAQLLAELEARS